MSYARAKFFWGALDIVHSDEASYTPTQTHAMGADGLPPGIGVRRAQIVWTRETMVPRQDAVTTHVDFLNLTNGQPDDTWTDADFTTVEQMINDMLTTIRPYHTTKVICTQVRWYRVGPGILPPNPAIRISGFASPGSATVGNAPQVAASVTLKTVPRKQWGRMYLPLNASSIEVGDGRFNAAAVDTVGSAVAGMVNSAVNAQFPPVIFSKVRGKAYTVETVQMDDVPDVIRSRRFNEATHKYISP